MELLDLEYYKNHFKTDIGEVFDYFPCLKGEKIEFNGQLGYVQLISIKGYLISKFDLANYFIGEDDIDLIKLVSMEICCFIPIIYHRVGCQVYDLNRVIDWDKLPIVHRHYNGSGKYGNLICTHLPEESKDMQNPILENLRTAYSLFLEYNRFINTGKWDIKEYKHGEEGRKEYYERNK